METRNKEEEYKDMRYNNDFPARFIYCPGVVNTVVVLLSLITNTSVNLVYYFKSRSSFQIPLPEVLQL